MLKISNLTVSESTVFGYSSNCYLLSSGEEAAVVDPSVECEKILAAIKREGVALKYIILTHGHFDHIHSLKALRDETGAEVMIHSADARCLSDPLYSLTAIFGYPEGDYPSDVTLLSDADEITLGEEKIKVVHTPGHSEGSICLLADDVLLTGDTLFDMSVGRYDFPGSSKTELLRSLYKIYTSFAECKIYPGHGAPSTVRRQITGNPINDIIFSYGKTNK